MFQCETSLLLKCDGNVRIPFQTKQGELTLISKERRVKGLRLNTRKFGVPLGGDRYVGGFLSGVKRVKCGFVSEEMWDFTLKRCSGNGPHLALRGNPVVCPKAWWEVWGSSRVAMRTSGT